MTSLLDLWLNHQASNLAHVDIRRHNGKTSVALHGKHGHRYVGHGRTLEEATGNALAAYETAQAEAVASDAECDRLWEREQVLAASESRFDSANDLRVDEPGEACGAGGLG